MFVRLSKQTELLAHKGKHFGIRQVASIMLDCRMICKFDIVFKTLFGFDYFFRSIDLVHEIACLDIYSVDGKENAELCAVGLWNDISAVLLTLPNLEKICHESLKGGKCLN